MLTFRWSNFYIIKWFGVSRLLILLFMFKSKVTANCAYLNGSRFLIIYSLDIFFNPFTLYIILFWDLIFWQFPCAKSKFFVGGMGCLFHLTAEFWRPQVRILVWSRDWIIFNLLFQPVRLLLQIHMSALRPRFPHFFYFVHRKSIEVCIARARVNYTILSLVALSTALLGNRKNITIIDQLARCLWFETLRKLCATSESTWVLDYVCLLLFFLFQFLSFDL